MTECIQHISQTFQNCCKYKVCYLFIAIVAITLIIFYYDKSYTIMPSFFKNQFSNTESPYIEIFNETILSVKNKRKILVWTTFFKGMGWEHMIGKCLQSCTSSCEVTSDREQMNSADALLFHLGDLKQDDLPSPRFLNQPWILFTLEPTTHIRGNLQWWGHIFNWTMSYRKYSTVFNPYGYYSNKTDLNSFSISYKSRTKDMFALISNCQDYARRYKLIEELSQHFKVDVYGRCSPNNLKCNPSEQLYCLSPNEIHKYKFRLSFENGHCRDYITEKYWNSLLQNAVPIVNWVNHQGNDNVIPNSYINIYDFKSIRSAIRYIKQVGDNETLYNSYHEWRRHYKPTASIYSGFCRLCDKLHQPFHAQVYRNLQNWFKDDTCNKYNLYDDVSRKVDRFLFDRLHG